MINQLKSAFTVLASMQKAAESLQFALHTVQTAFASLVQATGERGNKFMNKQIDYTDEPIGNLKLVADFLPPPEQLVLKEPLQKVTIALSAESVAFFKAEAKKHRTPYQKMIRQLLDQYVAHHQTNP
jgi:hypothetical protein